MTLVPNVPVVIHVRSYGVAVVNCHSDVFPSRLKEVSLWIVERTYANIQNNSRGGLGERCLTLVNSFHFSPRSSFSASPLGFTRYL